jgi:hypothetical protein
MKLLDEMQGNTIPWTAGYPWTTMVLTRLFSVELFSPVSQEEAAA